MYNKNKNNFTKILDLKAETCPMTFVKTRLAIEQIKSGENLKVYYTSNEAKKNVPKSIEELGHKVLKIKDMERNIFYILIKKK